MALAQLLQIVLAAAQWGVSAASPVAGEPNPPVWPSTVKVFGPEDEIATITTAVNAAFAQNGGHDPSDHGQFSSQRFAFLFKPGQYDVEVPVGFYTQILGLGLHPSEVIFTSAKGVYCEEGSYSINPGALDTFWRSAENFETQANFPWSGNPGMLWAASQAAPLRRLIVSGSLSLYQYTGGSAAGFSSGGYMANSQVAGEVYSGSQQQWITRNSEISKWSNGVWNMVFVGTKGAPPSHCSINGGQPYVKIDQTPLIAEKPFISIDAAGKYFLNIPPVQANKAGVDFDDVVQQVDFSNVYVATAADSASTMNAKLNQGLHIVLSPGVYNLDAPLELNTENQVLLGIGLATLVAASGTPVIKVGNVDGVRVAGVLLEAGSQPTEALLQWGDGSHPGSAANPGFIQDVFARVGGPLQPANAQAKVMVQIKSGYVIGDNMWLWRADHTASGIVKAGANPCEVAMIVDGDDVTMYGLAAEHTLTDILQWNGERGATYFFQTELPYDVTPAWGTTGYAGYRVNTTVQQHIAYGVGVYHYFRDYAVVVESGIVAPAHLEASFISPLTVYLNGLGTVRHIINDKGNSTSKDPLNSGAVPQWLCSGTPPTPTPPTPTPPAPPSGKCKVNQSVQCPGSTIMCGGPECCPDGSTCPSADDSFKGCPKPKKVDCTKGNLLLGVLDSVYV